MRFIYPIFLLVSLLMVASCNKTGAIPATEMPEELSVLKGKWKVVSFCHDNGFGIDTTSPPLFNGMEFDTKKVSLRFNNDLVRKDRFSFIKEEQMPFYILRFAGKKFTGYLSHYVVLHNDTLELMDRVYDGGTTYYLVKE